MSASFSFPEKGSFCHQILEFTKEQRERQCQCEMAKLFKCANYSMVIPQPSRLLTTWRTQEEQFPGFLAENSVR